MTETRSFRREDRAGVAVLVLDAEAPINTLSVALIAQIDRALAELEADARIKAVVLISGKRDTFIAGADLELLQHLHSAAEGTELSRVGKALLNRIEKSSKPWVAAIHGSCLGGGLEVALACRYRIASEDRVTQLGLPETQLGLIPGAGGTQRLPRLIGIQAALDLILTGKPLKAKKALKQGLVDEVLPAAILREVAARRALELALGELRLERHSAPLAAVRDPKQLARLALEENPVGRRVLFQQAKKQLLAKTHGNYPAPEKALEVVKIGYEKGIAAGEEAEAQAFGELAVSDVAKRLIEIFFAQNALKKDRGVDSTEAEPATVEHLALLGGGLMGGGIALVSLAGAGGLGDGGFAVRLKDQDDAGVGRGLAYVHGLLDERVTRKSLTPQQAVNLAAKLTTTTDYSGLHQADLFIEAVFEDLSLKRRVLAEVEAFAKPGAIFASNTSSLPIGAIAAEARAPENVVGMHYFSPVHKMPLLEVIQGPRSSARAVATAVAVGKRQGKTVIVVKDGPGFYTTRILAPYIAEAGFLVGEEAPIEEIDRALVAYGFPVGPLQLLDEIGIDVAAKIAAILQQAFGARMVPPAAFAKLHADGRAGRKNGKGFYAYGKEAGASGAKGRGVDASVYAAIGVKPRPGAVPAGEIAERASLQLINEAARCFGEGLLRSARDGDLGAIFGLGFPPFRGGPFHAIDALGAGEVVARLRKLEARFGQRFTPAPVLIERAENGQRFF